MSDEEKPKSKEYWSQYQSYTADITENSRKLGFAAVAICWLFKSEEPTGSFFPGTIAAALLFIVGFFISDILQQLVAGTSLRFWLYYKEKKTWNKSGYKTIEFNDDKPRWIDGLPFALFITKILLLFVGYTYIAKYILWGKLDLFFI